MSDAIVRLRIESNEYNNKIERATQGLLRMEQECRKVGGTLAILDKDQLEFVKGLGNMETKATSARGKIREMNQAFTEWSLLYKRLSDEEKNGDTGKALTASLDQLKTRITEAKTDLADVTKELGGTGVAGTDLTSILQGLGNQFGINSNLMGVVTTGAIGYTAAITAAATATIAATKAWVDYNNELSKQTQITTVTTGLKGTDADSMTDFAAAVSKIYNVDFRDTINAANTLMTQFGQTGEQAMSLIRAGMQGMISGDGPKLLNMIQQFAPAFRDAGISADQLVAVIHNSEGGLFSDQNMNAILMGIKNIRLMTSATSAALAKMGIDGEEMTKKMNDGSMTVFEALRQVSEAIEGANASSQEAGEVMQQVFGRQGAMQGMKLGRAIATLNTNLEETKMQTGAVGAAIASLESETERLNESIRRAVGYQGWDVMATAIKSEVVGAIASVIGTAESLRETIKDITGIDVFSTLISSALNAVGPVGMVLDKLRQIAGLGQVGSGDSVNGSGQRPQMQNPLQGVVDKFNRKSTIDQKPVEDVKKTTVTNPPKPTTTTTPSAKQTPETKAADIVNSAQEAYAQTMVEARLRMENGMDDTIAYKKKELDAQQHMFEAYGKAYAVYASPEYKEAYEQATDQYKRMASELAKSTEEQKIVTENAKALEAAQKKLAEEERKVAEAAAAGKYISKRAVNNARKEVERLTQIVDVKAGKVELPDIPKEVTVKVSADAKALEDAKKTLADAKQKLKEAETTGNQQNIYVSKRAVNNARKEVERLTQIVDLKAGKVELPDIPKEVEQVISTKVGEVLTPDIAAEIVQTISTQLGDIITPEIADQLTQTINTKVGEVVTPDIATELTQVVNVVTGDVELPDIPKEVEQVISTKVGEVLTPDIAAEIVQTISTQLGDIITPEIADQLTQTINTKVGEVVTPDIATELTQVVNVVTGDVDLPDIPKEKEVKVKFTQENLQALMSDLKTQQQQAVVGSMDYTKITEQIADANALKNVMQTALQEGLDNVVIDSQKLLDQLLNAENISDSVWENIIEQMNAGMKDRKSGKQYEFNAQTGDVKETKTATTNESVVGLMQKTAGGIGSIASGIEGLGAEIPEGFKDVIGGINSAMTIMQGIASILAIIETLNEAQSIGSFIPFFKNGGKVPHAATGLVVPGNDHSDHTLIAASSGEVILNRAQQSNLINDLDGAGRNVTVRGVIDGTTIRLVLDNTSRQMGKGTYVTSR